MKVLVTGGAGYIGSFMVHELIRHGEAVSVLDSLDRGLQARIPEGIKLYKGNLLDTSFLKEVFSTGSFDAVIHFAGYIAVGESMQDPYVYFTNNVTGSFNLVEAMNNAGVKRIIFSSSAGVYGNPQHVPIPESHPMHATSVYGDTKAMVEHLLLWYSQVYGFHSVALRYFNAAGAALDGSMGEAHIPETHIIPKAIESAVTQEPFALFGTDYETADGTCIRDYIHVLDLAKAHKLALKKIETESGFFVYNVGTGHGFSNKEVIEMIQKVSGKVVPIQNEPRRDGDPARLIADPSKIKEELGFSPEYSDLETIVTSAWKWHSKEHHG